MRLLIACVVALVALGGAGTAVVGGGDPASPLAPTTTVRPERPLGAPRTTAPRVDTAPATSTTVPRVDTTPRPPAQPRPPVETTTTAQPGSTDTTRPRLSAGPVTHLGPPTPRPQSIHP